ncbi:bifunctional folylpolyglutamate synthase/dihydrofolate synthase [Belliella kenyensis]|uniref:Dihydrofolate synthase/folylpolyglutamate synthase n=1 Tax=Belliella kenyensis TaxID=1472724 RepID=A0ABV8EKS4_9BACT|nr:folylpolyglutamate synthase/dihydrofolate synthase family protein [Belliella kenyensis]MCH7403759.1 bifunctional folylpolyglutamate synthase/dihydrofolate synthase [Belliella kenyensis]MDN3604437.1 folylpolyglutamate synthase/dihydrofolate synthase family protein [Belliella kenyensis]
MNYTQTLDYLFNALPMFQRVGAAAFKKDLSNTLALCKHLGDPHQRFKSIHVAGTNGKGSSSHALCSVLMQAGYKVGLYTSPHLKSFTERVKINGVEIQEDEVVQFVNENKGFLDELKPSFFEMTVGLAFWYFAKMQVDIAIVEVGMGGRLDSTNVIQPEVCLITNIGYDHMQYLGDTLEAIAGEKAGIIKQNTPVVISQRQAETSHVFNEVARAKKAPIFFAEDYFQIDNISESESGVYRVSQSEDSFVLEMDLKGNYQQKNLSGVLKTLDILRTLGFSFSQSHLQAGLENIVKNTGLKGRWQYLSESPTVLCDTGHNEDGINYILNQLKACSFDKLWMVLGMVNDKDLDKVLSLLPKDANYVFVAAKIPRAMPAATLLELGFQHGLDGIAIDDVNDGLAYAKKNASKDDLIFVGGSTFVVAEINDL